jgi:hypothetical protein
MSHRGSLPPQTMGVMVRHIAIREQTAVLGPPCEPASTHRYRPYVADDRLEQCRKCGWMRRTLGNRSAVALQLAARMNADNHPERDLQSGDSDVGLAP